MSEELAFKQPVRLATTANIVLTGEQTIDGFATSEDRVLVKNQSTASQNGIYVSSSGPWQRASDFNGPDDFTTGTMVRVTEGTANAGTVWACTASDDPPNVGTSTISFAAFGPSSLVLTGDTAAIEALTGTGLLRRTGSDAWSLGTRVSNAELATMAQATLKGRAGGAGTGDATDLTATQATALLNAFTGDSGAGGVKGLVPAPASGDAAKYLKGDGTWGSGGSATAASESGAGVVFLASNAEAVTGTDTAKAVTAAGAKAAIDAAIAAHSESLIIAVSDETTPLTAGTGKVTFRMPYALTLSAVRASLAVAQTSGSILTVDVNEGASSILSTRLTIDNGERTTATAATAAVISDASLADDAEITIDIDTVGDGTAKGLKVTLIGTRP